MKTFIIQVNDALENNIALVYKSIFLGETAALLSSIGCDVSVYDFTIENYTFADILKTILLKPDVIFFNTDTNQSRIALRISTYIKKISPETKIMIFGRATSFIPQYFFRFPFDAIHTDGDREAAIIDYVSYLRNEKRFEDISNLTIVINGNTDSSNKVTWLQSNEWFTPDLSKLPMQKYEAFNAIRKRNEKLVVGITASKGCPYQCQYCGASKEEGIVDRYIDPQTIIDWTKKNDLENYIVQLWSTNILKNYNWLKEYCRIYINSNCNFRWRGVTRIDSIDEDKVKLISTCGCEEIAVGVEMINSSSQKLLKSSLDNFYNVIALFKKYSIKLKCLLMLGYPNYSLDDVKFTINLLHDNSLNYRITGYTPLHKLAQNTIQELDDILIENYDRRTYYEECGIPADLFYEILLSNGECLYE